MPKPQSLEEAFAANMEQIRTALGFVPYDDEEERQQAVEQARDQLRNLALAVLEEAYRHYAGLPEWDENYAVLDTRIAALGERDGS